MLELGAKLRGTKHFKLAALCYGRASEVVSDKAKLIKNSASCHF
jgi:hypothetical protein